MHKKSIHDWLLNQGIKTCRNLRNNDAFLDFIQTLFPDKTRLEISDKVYHCCVAADDIENFSGCLSTGLSSK